MRLIAPSFSRCRIATRARLPLTLSRSMRILWEMNRKVGTSLRIRSYVGLSRVTVCCALSLTFPFDHLFFFAALVSSGSVVLTGENFDSLTAGKNAFVKFMAPWCGHCKSMKAAWEQLGDEYSGSKSVVIGDVDCTVEADLCSKHGVSGYPTVKYWKDGESHAYNGGRDLDSLLKHTKDNLAPACTLEDQSPCSDRELDFIAKTKDLPKEKLESQLTRLSGMASAKAKPELKQWINQRANILKQLIEKA